MYINETKETAIWDLLFQYTVGDKDLTRIELYKDLFKEVEESCKKQNIKCRILKNNFSMLLIIKESFYYELDFEKEIITKRYL